MEKSEPKYKFAFNKVFTGSYLIYNLGNELINFIETDNHKRLVYLNPYGNRSQKAADETKYVLHIMKTEYNNEKCYELVAVSKILEDSTGANEKTYYNSQSPKDEKVEYKKQNLKFKKHFISDIFDDPKAHLCSFYAEKLLEPQKNIRILFKGKTSKNNVSKKVKDSREKGTKGIFTIKIESDLSGCRNLCYSRENDLDVLNDLIESKEYLKIINNTIKLKNINDEQCLAVICDRTNLEDSMSNQIAYFLSRNKKALENFIKLLNSKINQDTEKIAWSNKINFKIIREHNKIDILLESAKDIIVIENKIDSSIIEYNKNKSNSNIPSQLSKYYEYIMEDYEILKAFKYKTVEEIKTELKTTKKLTKKDLIKMMKKGDFNNKKKHFFILKPEYNSINEDKLKKYLNGDKYQIITYTELYEKLNSEECKKEIGNSELKFLYDQFLQSLEYVKSTKAEQMRKTAYIRLKQRLNELDNKKLTN